MTQNSTMFLGGPRDGEFTSVREHEISFPKLRQAPTIWSETPEVNKATRTECHVYRLRSFTHWPTLEIVKFYVHDDMSQQEVERVLDERFPNGVKKR